MFLALSVAGWDLSGVRRSAMRSSAASFFEAGNRAHVVRASRAHRAVATCSSITVIDFGKIAQPTAADRRQQLPIRANIGVAPHVVAKLVLAKEALAHRGAALRSGNVRDAARLLAGLDVLDLEVAAVGDDVDGLDVQNLAAGSAVCVNRPMSTTWLVTACSTISLFFASTAT